jgi:hypothetical protein
MIGAFVTGSIVVVLRAAPAPGERAPQSQPDAARR